MEWNEQKVFLFANMLRKFVENLFLKLASKEMRDLTYWNKVTVVHIICRFNPIICSSVNRRSGRKSVAQKPMCLAWRKNRIILNHTQWAQKYLSFFIFRQIFTNNFIRKWIEITLDIQNDIHDTRTRRKYFYQEKEIWNGIKDFKWK